MYYVIETIAGGQRPMDAIMSFNIERKVKANGLFLVACKKCTRWRIEMLFVESNPDPRWAS